MKGRTLVSFVTALFLGIVLLVASQTGPRSQAAPASPLKAGTFDPAQQAPDFRLSGGQRGGISLGQHRGKVVLLTFGFTHCAAVCPTTLATLAQMRKALGQSAGKVQVIFVTVDPERDTAELLASYVQTFDHTFLGATGTPEFLAAVRQSYGVTAAKEGSGRDYAMAHTSSIYLIDGAGKLRALMPYGRDAADFVHDVKILLGE